MSKRRYTEDQFRTAVADPTVRTMADLCRSLGLVPRGANYETLRIYARRLSIDVDHVLRSRRDREARTEAVHAPGAPRNRPSYTDEQLANALADPNIDSYPALCAALELQPLSNTYRRLRERAEALGSPIPPRWSAHRGGGRRASPKSLVPRAELEDAVVSARSLADVIRALGRKPSKHSYRWVTAAIELYGLDTTHFTPYRRTNPGRRRRPLSEVLVDGRATASRDLRQRLIEEGLREHRCERCGRAEWNGEPIPLELDHIDGDRLNNTLENLRLLCPNCHAQTPTYRGRNIGRHTRPRRGEPPSVS